MEKESKFLIEGEILEALPNALFKAKIAKAKINEVDLDEKIILCHLSGKMRRFYIKVMVGDKVKIEMTPYDLSKGRIVYRFQ